MAIVNKTFRIFVSSTFSDLKGERNMLQREVFPKLRDLCMKHGYRFQAIDLRWGVREESALDQQTMNICLEEVARCQRPPNPNFIVLLGDRYGWQPLPAEIPASEFEQIENLVSNQKDRILLHGWYKRDDNVVPAVYCLQPREVEVKKNATDFGKKTARNEESKLWDEIEPKLRKILRNAIENISFIEEQKLKYISSATEQEIVAGALNVPDAREHVFSFFRKIEEGLPRDESAKDYIDLIQKGVDWQLDEDAHIKLKELKKKLREKSGKDNIFEYSAEWEENGVTTNHIPKLCEDVYNSLSKIIVKEISLIEDKSSLERETDAHEEFRKERAKVFVGRVEILKKIQDYITKADKHPLVVYGESGTGKSALMACSLDQTQDKNPDAEVIYRFIGATPESSDGRALLESLCRQIYKVFNYEQQKQLRLAKVVGETEKAQKEREGINLEYTITGEMKKLPDTFYNFLFKVSKDKQLIIFMDALDQLSDANNIENLNWLPAELPENVRLIVSTLPDQCYEALKGKIPAENLMVLLPMPADEGAQLLDLWLSDAKRALQTHQRKEIIDNFSREGNGKPLYLKLVFEESRKWKSYTGKTEISPDIWGVIQDLFKRLSKDENHGDLMVSRCLGYLAAAKNGLTEDELMDVLSNDIELYGRFLMEGHHIPADVMTFLKIYIKKQNKSASIQGEKNNKEISESKATEWFNKEIKKDKNILKDFLTEAYKESQVKKEFHFFRLPMVLWSRLYFDLEPYMTERSADGTSLMTFYHPTTFGAKVKEEYLSGITKTQRHQELAEYFGNQLLYIDKKIPNLRKISELPYLLTHGEMWDEVSETLCDLEFIQAKCEVKQVYDLVNDFNTALESIPDNTENIRIEKERQARLDKYANDLIRYSKEEINEIELPGSITTWNEEKTKAEIERIKTKPNRADKLKSFYNFIGHDVANLQKHAQENPYLATQQAWNYADSGPVGEAAEKIPSEIFNSLLLRTIPTRPSWNPLPQALKTIDDQIFKVNAVAIIPNGKIAFVGLGSDVLDYTCTCNLLDLQSGKSLKIFKGHTKAVNSVAITPDGKIGFSGSEDKKCILWDIESGMPLKFLIGHTKPVTSVAITPNKKWALSGSKDGTCISWDLEKGIPFKKIYDWGFQHVTAVDITSEGKFALIGCWSKSLVLWDLEKNKNHITLQSGILEKNVIQHTAIINTVAFSPDGKIGFSGSGDGCIQWDLEACVPLKKLTGGTNYISITPDGKLGISGSWDGSCTLWDLEVGIIIKKLIGHTKEVTSVAITPDGKMAVSGSLDNTCILWDLESGQPGKILQGHSDVIKVAAITPNGKMALSGSRDSTCKLWDLKSGLLCNTIRLDNSIEKTVSINFESLIFTPDGKWAVSGTSSDSCIIWDLDNGILSKALKGHMECGIPRHFRYPRRRSHVFEDFVAAVSISPDGKMVLSGYMDGTCILWDLKNGTLAQSLKGHTNFVKSIAFTPDGKMALTGSKDNSCILWDLENGMPYKTLLGHTDHVTTVAIMPDGKMAISGSDDKTCIIWNLERGQAYKTLRGHKSSIENVTISPDGKTAISSSSDETCIIWNLEIGYPLKELKGHTKFTNAKETFTPDGKMVILGSRDHTFSLWDCEDGEKLAQYFTTVSIYAVGTFPLSVFGSEGAGEVSIFHAQSDLLRPRIGITTARRIWDYKLKQYQSFSADCPFCSTRFSPPKSVLEAIDEITKNCDPSNDQSSWLELKYADLEDKKLRSQCPNCRIDVKFNPFVVNNKTIKRWEFWKNNNT